MAGPRERSPTGGLEHKGIYTILPFLLCTTWEVVLKHFARPLISNQVDFMDCINCDAVWIVCRPIDHCYASSAVVLSLLYRCHRCWRMFRNKLFTLCMPSVMQETHFSPLFSFCSFGRWQAVKDPASEDEQIPRQWWIWGLLISALVCIAIDAPLFHMPVWQVVWRRRVWKAYTKAIVLK